MGQSCAKEPPQDPLPMSAYRVGPLPTHTIHDLPTTVVSDVFLALTSAEMVSARLVSTTLTNCVDSYVAEEVCEEVVRTFTAEKGAVTGQAGRRPLRFSAYFPNITCLKSGSSSNNSRNNFGSGNFATFERFMQVTDSAPYLLRALLVSGRPSLEFPVSKLCTALLRPTVIASLGFEMPAGLSCLSLTNLPQLEDESLMYLLLYFIQCDVMMKRCAEIEKQEPPPSSSSSSSPEATKDEDQEIIDAVFESLMSGYYMTWRDYRPLRALHLKNLPNIRQAGIFTIRYMSSLETLSICGNGILEGRDFCVLSEKEESSSCDKSVGMFMTALEKGGILAEASTITGSSGGGGGKLVNNRATTLMKSIIQNALPPQLKSLCLKQCTEVDNSALLHFQPLLMKQLEVLQLIGLEKLKGTGGLEHVFSAGMLANSSIRRTLTTLSLHGCPAVDNGALKEIGKAQLTALTSLDLSDLVIITSEGLAHLSGPGLCKTLRFLTLAGCRKLNCPAALGAKGDIFTALELLDLTDCWEVHAYDLVHNYFAQNSSPLLVEKFPNLTTLVLQNIGNPPWKSSSHKVKGSEKGGDGGGTATETKEGSVDVEFGKLLAKFRKLETLNLSESSKSLVTSGLLKELGGSGPSSSLSKLILYECDGVASQDVQALLERNPKLVVEPSF